MFYALNANTNERVNAIQVYKDLSYQLPQEDLWLADPESIDNWEELNKKGIYKIKVVFIKAHSFIKNGKSFAKAEHFRIPNKEELGVNLKPETIEHKRAKNWICQESKEDKISFFIEGDKSKLSKKLSDFSPNWPLLDIEQSSSQLKKTRRADVLVPFLKKDDFLGNGIVFEIQFSKQYEATKEDRTFDWGLRGFSVCWIEKSDFEIIESEHIDLKKDSLTIIPFAAILKKSNSVHVKNLKWQAQEISRQMDSKIDDLKKMVRQEVLDEFKQKILPELREYAKNIIVVKNDEIPNCEFNFNHGKMRLKTGKNGYFWGCQSYPSCKCTKQYIPYYTLKNDRN